MAADHILRRAGFIAALVLFSAGIYGAAPANTAPNVTFTATGTFASPPLSGEDQMRLAGEPFTISIVASSASEPFQHGRNWGVFGPFVMHGTVHSGLLGTSPINIYSKDADIYQTVGPDYDPWETGFPVDVVGIDLTIQAQITLPAGTLAKPYIHPFSPVTLSPTNTYVTYSDGTNTTALAIASGTLQATIPSGSAARGESDAAAAPPGPVLWYEAAALIPRLRRFELRNP